MLVKFENIREMVNLTQVSARRERNRLLLGVIATSVIFVVSITAQSLSVRTKYQNGDFSLVYKNKPAAILTSREDFTVVQIAAHDLAADVERVTGKRPTNVTDMGRTGRQAVIIGTLGKCHFVDDLVKAKKIDVSGIRNKWETFTIATVKDPFPNVGSALVIAGSDRRGTAYGIYEMSQMIGVSPWYWWADVTPEHKNNLIISPGVMYSHEPSVKYRGIFLNDEDWGLQPWAAKTFEPETGNLGPKTYAKIFELMLRLKANTVWPAMHEVTRPFNSISANRQIADDYAIVMGSSHAEPMLRNNVGEWTANKDDYNFVTNPGGVTDYWEQRVKENGRYENIYTIGMRGIHDSPILGTKGQADRIPLLEKIFAVQRSLLGRYVDPNVEAIPQIFCPYKEVLADYQAGLKVPDDVTIVFPDDNFGYIRQFPTAEERKRKGGFGVYYHISYLGRPLSYLWLNSVPPALIWEEMSKSYANGMNRFWILNVGDIKPGEIGIDLFLQMAYDAKKWDADNIDGFLILWAMREFGPVNSASIAKIMDSYFRLGFQRKPEHLQWFLPGERPRKSALTEREIQDRLRAYAGIRDRAETIAKRIAPTKQSAFYELVLYPIRSAAAANARFFAAELAESYKTTDPKSARDWAERSVEADAMIAAEAKYFNNDLEKGKWRNIMSPEITPGQWTSMRSIPPKLDLSDFESGPQQDRLAAGIPRSLDQRQSPQVKGFSEVDGIVSIEAEHYSRTTGNGGVVWKVIRGLGRTGDSVTLIPSKARTFVPPTAPSLEYKLKIAASADFTLNFALLPTQPFFGDKKIRIAYSFDSGPPVTIDLSSPEVGGREWSHNVMNELNTGSSACHMTKGDHVLTVFAVDTGIVLDKIVFSSRSLTKSYLGPAETSFQHGAR